MNDKVILYVDDDADDRELLTAVIRQKDKRIIIIEAGNGREALQYLHKVKLDGDTFPCLIVLDINMPILDGRETFRHLQADPALKQLPVMILTSSLDPADKNYFHSHGIKLVAKPTDIRVMEHLAGDIIAYCN
jgi:CheY-like chemotaxis protein